MLSFIRMFSVNQLEEIRKFYQSVPNETATSAGNAEDVNVNMEFLEVFKSSFIILRYCINEGANKFKEMQDTINILEDTMQDLFQKVTTSTYTNFDDIVILATAYVNISMLFIYVTKCKKFDIAEAHLIKSMKLLNGKELEPKAILTAMKTFLDLSFVYKNMQRSEERVSVLHKIIELFSKYTKEEEDYPDPIRIALVLGIDDGWDTNSKILLEEHYFMSLECLANDYFNKSLDKHRFVICVHNMLNKRIAETKSQSMACLSWANTSAALSCYFTLNHRLTEARNHIVAAEYMMEVYHKNMLKTVDQKENPDLFADVHKIYEDTRAEIAENSRFYELMLLYLSRNRFLQTKDDKSCEVDNSKPESGLESQKELTKFLIFSDLEKDLENFKTQLTDNKLRVSNINDAKKIVLNIIRYFNESKKYYFSDTTSCYYKVAVASLQISKAHAYLISFERDIHRQIKLHKHQIMLLKAVIEAQELKEMKFYDKVILMAALIQMTEVYASIVNIKTTNLYLSRKKLNEVFRVEILSEIKQLLETIQILFPKYD